MCHDAIRLTRIRSHKLLLEPLLAGDHHRHPQWQLRVDASQRIIEPGTHRRTPQLEDRLISERGEAHAFDVNSRDRGERFWGLL
jgi:hypothetical protein